MKGITLNKPSGDLILFELKYKSHVIKTYIYKYYFAHLYL
jgi:hypothetical protein